MCHKIEFSFEVERVQRLTSDCLQILGRIPIYQRNMWEACHFANHCSKRKKTEFCFGSGCRRRRRNNFSGPAAAAIAVIRDPQEGRSLDRASELDRASSLSTVIADEQLEAPPDRSQRPGDCDMCNVRDGSSLRASPEHRSRTQDRIGWGGGCGGQEGNIEWWRESS